MTDANCAWAQDPETGAPFLVVVAGPPGVGKTCAVMWFVRGALPRDPDDVVPGFEVHLCAAEHAQVDLLDGPEALVDEEPVVVYSELVPRLKRAVGMLALFDVTQRQSMADMYAVVERNQRLLDMDDLPPLPFAVLGTHIDQADQRVVTTDEARAAAAEHGASYAEISALTGENVRAAFTEAIVAFVTAGHPSLNDNTRRQRTKRKPRRDLRSGCKHQ